MRSQGIFLAAAILCITVTATKDCLCADGSMPLNYRDVTEWQNSNDPDHPQSDPPKVECGDSKPNSDCPTAKTPPETGNVDIVKKGKCFGWERKDGTQIAPDDLAHQDDTRQCMPVCADEIAREKAKGNSTGAVCTLHPDHFVPEGDYKHIIGDCICNPSGGLALAEEFVNWFLSALPLLAEIIKDVWLEAFELVLTLPLNAIPGVGGALETAVVSTIAAAKLCEWTYGAATGLKAFVQWGKGLGKLGEDIGDTYKAGAGRADQGFKPPEGLPKGSGKDGDKGAPPGWDKLDDGSDAISKKGDKPPKCDKGKGDCGNDKPPKCDKKKDKDCDKDKKTEPHTKAHKSTEEPKTKTQRTTSAHTTTMTTLTTTKSSSLRSTSSASLMSGQPCSPSCAACKPKSGKSKGGRRTRDVDQLSREDGPEEQVLEKRLLRTPADFGGDAEKFLMDQWKRSVQLNLDAGTENRPSTAITRWLEDQTLNTAVGGLYGCTAVIVASQSGVWLSHFWEIPSFRIDESRWGQVRRHDDFAQFQTQVLDPMQFGDTPAMPGLVQFTGPGQAFSSEQHPEWAILTPARNSPFTITPGGRFRYDEEVGEIQAVLRALFPGAPPRIIPYEPNGNPEAQRSTSTGKFVLAYDPWTNQEINPDNQCEFEQQAGFLGWFEDRQNPVFQKTWYANLRQLITDGLSYRIEPPHPSDYLRLRRGKKSPGCELPDPLPKARESKKGRALSNEKAPDPGQHLWFTIRPDYNQTKH